MCQDWGGPIGLRVLSEAPGRFAAVVVANTLLPNFEPPPQGIADWPGAAIAAWAESTQDGSRHAGWRAINTSRPSSSAVKDAPFPDPSGKAGPLHFPALIPIRPDMPGIAENRRAWAVLDRFDKPFLTAFSDGDPFTKPWEAVFRHRVPGARGQPHAEIRGAGHFLQEDQGEGAGRNRARSAAAAASGPLSRHFAAGGACTVCSGTPPSPGAAYPRQARTTKSAGAPEGRP